MLKYDSTAMSHIITLTIPDDLYRRLLSSASASDLPIDEVLVQSLRAGSPPDIEGVPLEYRDDVAALPRFSDEQLLELSRIEFPTKQFTLLEELLRKNANGELNEEERKQLADLQQESNRFMIRRAFVFALLRWRGHAVPQLST